MPRYEVVEKKWVTAGFFIQVVRIPEEVINAKLAILSDGSGRLSWARYVMFLVNTCVVSVENIFSFLSSLANTEISNDERQNTVIELRDIILEVNPLLNPNGLVITKENIIKLPEQTDSLDETRPLVNNPSWEIAGLDFTNITRENYPTGDEINDQSIIPFSPTGTAYSSDQLVPYEWEKLDIPILVIAYSPNDVVDVFKKRFKFPDKETYKKYIVISCIHDSALLFQLLDQMDFVSKYGVEELTNDLYNISVEINPFLAWEDIDLILVKKEVEKVLNKKRAKHSKFSKKKNKNKKEQKEDTSYESLEEVPLAEIASLPERLKKQVIGQEEAINKVCENIRLARSGLKRTDVPIGVFLFSGRSGVGKTHLAKMLAQELCHNSEALIRLDGAEYSQRHEISKILGAPPGYVGHDNASPFLEMVNKTPFNVILLDEIDKAHNRLYDVFLSVFDDGRLTDSKGEVVTFGNSIIIMTANVGVKEVDAISNRIGLGDTAVLTDQKAAKTITEALKQKFRPEFLNRIDGQVVFNSLSQEVCYKIIDLAFTELNGYLLDKNTSVVYTDEVKEFIFKEGFDSNYGARPLNRAMKRLVYLPLSKLLLSSEKINGKRIYISVFNDKLDISYKTTKFKKKTTKKRAILED